MAHYVNAPLFQAIGPNGVPYSGAKLYLYATGTTTLLAVYSDEALTIPAANPVIADADGVFASVFLETAPKFKIMMTDAGGTVLQTRDPVYSVGLSGDFSADQVDYDNSLSGLSAGTVKDALDELTILTDGLDDAKSDVGHTHSSSNITDFSEAVDDRVSALVSATGAIVKTYDDAAGALTLYAATGAFAILEDQKASGTNGGTRTAGSWETRSLNTEVWDPANLVTLATNAFTATIDGFAHFAATFYKTNTSQLRLYNVTDSVVAGRAINGRSDSAATSTSITLTGVAPITAGKTYRLESYVATTAATSGAGYAVSTGEPEVYATVTLYRRAA